MGKEAEGSKQLGPVRVWTLAAGGMVGGGIYIALGVVISVAGQWAWLSFVIAGLIAVISAFSYSRLSRHYGESGGIFRFLEELHRPGIAGSLSWLLIIGYTLTISVYAYAFGHYVAHAFGGGSLLIRALAIAIGVGLIGLNLAGVGKMTGVEVVIVTGNLLILLVLAAIGLFRWAPVELVAGIEPRPPYDALVGGAAIFVSYEGFQLLTYEYEQVKDAERLFVPVLVSAAVTVVLIYVAVTLGATMLAGALTMVEQRQVALSIAAERVGGHIGMIVMTIAAAFATAAAINSTLFSTGKLAARVAAEAELPSWFDHKNRLDLPDRPIVLIGLLATFLAVIGSLSSLVEAASLVFLATFLMVNIISYRELETHRWISITGIVLGAIVGLVLMARLLVTEPLQLTILLVLAAFVFIGRLTLLNQAKTEEEKS